MTAPPHPEPPAEPAAPPPSIRRLRAVRAVLWALVGVMVAAWLFFGGGLESLASTVGLGASPSGAGAADVGQRAPDLRLPLAGGGEVSLDQLRGKVVLLNFWATWCGPCRVEMPVFERAYQYHGPHGLVVLAVDVQEREADVLAYLREVGTTFPSALDATGETARRWRAVGLPTTFLIDRQGIIRHVRMGPYTEEMLEEQLNGLLHGFELVRPTAPARP